MNTLTVGKIRAVVADDHNLTLSGVADSLATHDIDVVGRASSARDAISLVEKLAPDVLVSDLDFGPGPTGLDVADHLRKKFPLLGIVILSAYGDPRLHANSLQSAPTGLVYLVKQQVSSTAEIVSAVALSRERAAQAKEGLLPRADLTEQQILVLRLVAQGLSNSAIATALSVSDDSVAKTIHRMCKRLGIVHSPEVNSRARLIQSYFDLVGANP